MPTPDDIAAQQRRLSAQRQTLGDLLVQQTSLDAHTPPYVRQGIREACAEIRRLKAVLRAWETPVEELPDDDADTRLPTHTPDNNVPTCPPPPLHLFGRAEIIGELVAQLTGQPSGTVAIGAVRGLPGVGKTALLRAIGCDVRIISHFGGGALYAELGPTPDRSQIMRRWIVAFGVAAPQSDDITI